MATIQGNLSGISRYNISLLESIYEQKVPPGKAITTELAELLAKMTEELNKEIAVYINRNGKIVEVAVGDRHTVNLPETSGRRSAWRLSGIRCLHTHPVSDSKLSSLDISSLKDMRFDLMAALGIKAGTVAEVSFGIISGLNPDESFQVQTVGPLALQDFIEIDINFLTVQIDRALDAKSRTTTIKESERAVIVGVDGLGNWDINDSLRELAQLAETAGAEVVAEVTQKRQRPDIAYFIGKGKVEEIVQLCQTERANLVILDDELSPAQQRNLENALGIKTLDRTALILDIFAQRAQTHEGKLQVELAQLKYNLPRLGGLGLILSRLGGGIGTRGPGETKLEVDRRRIRARISDVEHDIKQIKVQRALQRERRQSAGIPSMALVGYTNAGKSTLLNTLTDAGVLAENKLFATLDPTTRKIAIPGGQEAIITDTVGFIQKLPHQLVAAFRATLEEVVQADLLLHVIDASHPRNKEQSDAVFEVLREIGAGDKPVITVFNKIDKMDNLNELDRLMRTPDSVAISAINNSGIDTLLDIVRRFLRRRLIDFNLLIPYNDSGILAKLYDLGTVIKTEYEAEGINVYASLRPDDAKPYYKYMIGDYKDE